MADRGEERGHRQQLLHLRHQQGGHRDLPQVGHPPHYHITVSSDFCILIKGVFLRRREAGSQGLRTFLRLQLRGGSGREPDPRPEQDQGRPPGDPGGPEPLQADQGQMVSEGESPTQGSSPVILVYFQMTQRLDLYAESLAKAIDHNYKPDIIH